YMLARNAVLPSQRRWLFAGAVVIANLPDFDILPGLLRGNPSAFHHQETHSLAAAVLFGLLIGGLARQWQGNGIGWAVWAGGLYLSHIILDLSLDDPSPPYGLQLLWPFSSAYFISPFTPFESFSYTHSLMESIGLLFSPHNLNTMTRELVLMAPFVGLAWYLGSTGRRS
ncbi:MAG: metal-dependent hydrolase, partial [Candidatus Binatia bacterium]